MANGSQTSLTRVQAIQNISFLMIIILCYLDELLQLSSWVFYNHAFVINFRKAAIEMLLILVIWLLVSTSTRRLLDRIHYLEKFMRVCSWCHRVSYKSKWMPLEEFLQQEASMPPTHGICPDCLARQMADLEKFKQAQFGSGRQSSAT